MSTKINVRSPFYLNLTEPVQPTPSYDCNVAQLQGFVVDNQGIITQPTASYGTVFSFTSTDSGFANQKYATVSTAVTRTLAVTLRIPAGFTNTSDVYFVCSITATQPIASSCTTTVTTSGTIADQTLNSGGATVSIDLSGKFTGESTYAVTNTTPVLITTAISGSTLTLSSNNIGGTGKVYALGRDANYPTTCEAVQPIAFTINVVGSPAFSCNANPLTGGAISQAGAITNPQTDGTIEKISLTSDGSAITSVSANTGTNAQDVTLYFKILVPAGYSNAGASLHCPKLFSQPGTTAPTLTCGIVGLHSQSISTNGSINIGKALVGTVKSFTTPPWLGTTVDTDTSRDVEFQILIPSGYSGANGSATVDCTKTGIIQPAAIPICGGNNYFLSAGVLEQNNFCDNTRAVKTAVTSTSSGITTLLGSQICRNGSPFPGKDRYYAVNTSSVSSGAGIGVGSFYNIQISDVGIVVDLAITNCDISGGNGSTIIL
jgi:hypothetical protein